MATTRSSRHLYALYLAALLGGAAVWIAICAASGQREAWDHPSYFRLGYPLLLGYVLLIGLRTPARSSPASPVWIGVMSFLGQIAVAVARDPVGGENLAMLSLVVLSTPAILTAWLGVVAKRTWCRWRHACAQHSARIE